MTSHFSRTEYSELLRKGKRIRVETRPVATGSFGLVADARAERASVSLALPMPPSANNMFVNNPHGGRFKSERYEGWLTEAGWELAAQKPGRIAGAYEIEIIFSRVDKRRRDLGNLEKGISDLLVKHRVVSDDCFAEKITLRWSRDGEGCRVILTKVEGEYA